MCYWSNGFDTWSLNMLIWKEFMKEFRRAAAFGPRLYFAPLVGAYRHTRREWRRAQRELSRPESPYDAGAGSSRKGIR